MDKIKITNCRIFTFNEENEIIDRGEIVIQGDSISYIGKIRENNGEKAQEDYSRVIDARGQVCLPGFINAHTHAPMTLFRGFADDLPLMTWLETKIWPAEEKLKGEDVYWGTLLSCLEMIKSGTTTFNDMYFFMEDMANAVSESGIRAVLSRGLIGLDEKKAALGLKETEQLISTWHNSADGRIRVMFGPHAPYTCQPDYLQKIMEKAEQYGLPLHIHLAETRFEVEQSKELYQMTPIEHMESLGLFNFPVVAAHCVHLSPNDIEILSRRNVAVAHNPGSNLKLASGVAPVPQLLEAGVTVSLGTDSAASNNNLDMLEEIRLAALIHKGVSGDPMVVPAYKALEMASREGAKSLFWEDEIGILKPGYKADLILLNMQKPHLCPLHDPAAHIVYAAQSSDIETVMINGEIIMENREMKNMDEEKIMHYAQKLAFTLTGGMDDEGTAD